MQRYIAFLRGVNLGKRRLPITQLRDSFEEVGFDDVETLIASGVKALRLPTSTMRNLTSLRKLVARHID